MSAQPRRLSFKQPDPPSVLRRVEVQVRPPPAPAKKIATNANQSTAFEPKNCCMQWQRQLKEQKKVRKAREAEKRARKKQAAREARDEVLSRLPHGSHYETSYDAASKTWSGVLVTTVRDERATFSATHTGLFKLLAKLDGMYRDAVGAVATTTADVT